MSFKAIKYLLLTAAAAVAIVCFVMMLYPTTYGAVIEHYAGRYQLSPSVVYAIIKTESGFDSNSVSRKGAKGLMQIMDTTGEWGFMELQKSGDFDSLLLFEPELNIEIGCWYFDKLLKQYESADIALAAYNAGSGNVSKWLKNPDYYDGERLYNIPFKETRQYVEKVNKNKKMYEILRGIQG